MFSGMQVWRNSKHASFLRKPRQLTTSSASGLCGGQLVSDSRVNSLEMVDLTTSDWSQHAYKAGSTHDRDIGMI
jgi:hypothetical protein